MDIRKKRKDEHLRYTKKLRFEEKNGFEHYHLFNDSIPEINYDSVCTKWSFLDRTIDYPIMINAITGGTWRGKRINKALAELAAEFHIPMAVGSQKIALKDTKAVESFSIVRKVNRDGIVIGNLSAAASVNDVRAAIEMIEADAIQLHLNVPQEICMNEGDRCFKGILDNISEIRETIDIPIIVKETGFGISPGSLKKLLRIGIEYVDIGGYGGTNFVKIENQRVNKQKRHTYLENWGIPTAVSLTECRKVSKDINIICSGGIRTGYDIIKGMKLGADLMGISGALLRNMHYDPGNSLRKNFTTLIDQLITLMLLTGAKNIDEIRNVSLYVDSGVPKCYEQEC